MTNPMARSKPKRSTKAPPKQRATAFNRRPAESQRPVAARTPAHDPIETAEEDLAAEPVLAFPVVGIGASAGGLEAASELLAALPGKAALAVIVVQHLAPTHSSVLASLLSDKCKLPVVQVKEAQQIELGQVYVIPPNTQLTIDRGKLHLTPRPGDRSQYRSIDFFLQSLAAYAKTQAIAVILSGTDSDGSMGLREIKAEGGIAIAQDPQTAKFDGMPRAAIATGMVDLVLAPADIAREIVRIATHAPEDPDASWQQQEEPSGEQNLPRVFSLLRSATGVDFTHYKLPTIRRRMQRRMVLHKIGSVSGYVKLLQQDPGEVRALYRDILIHVTRFFRDPDTFDTLSHRIFPEILATRERDQPVRIWVPGCSTGEEAYSIAICLLECLGDDAGTTQVQIFATDVSDDAIEKARAGSYPESSLADVSPERLRRFFNKIDGTFRVNKSVRDLCVFARQDLTRDPPFSKLDLIVCRNVLIYLGAVLQKKLMNVFHYAMKPGGFLMLGPAETTGASSDLFTVVDKRHRVYGRRATNRPAALEIPVHDRSGDGQDAGRRRSVDGHADGKVQQEANRIILARYQPPGVVVDNDLRIVQFRGQTGAFLEPAPGEASLNLLKMAREGMLFGLRGALNEARRTDKPVRRTGLRVKQKGHVAEVDVEVIPIKSAESPRHFLVIFHETTPHAQSVEAPGDGKKSRAAAGQKNDRVSRLQEELAASREYLQSIIQDLEATNEELQSANEEVLSANEELQSTNEELDTAKEELQSTNEELNTVNDELQARNEEMSRVNSDLVNLLANVQIAIVMVAGDLRIRRYTPMAERVLNLIPTDVGRPISDIKSNIDCPDLERKITEVVETVASQECEVRDRNGAWFALRIRPYKNIENRIDGAVLALFDIDAARRQEVEARQARMYADAIVETLRQPLLVLDSDLRIRRVNRAFYDMFKVSPVQTEGKLLHELGNGQWNIPALRAHLTRTVEQGGVFEGFRVEHEFPSIGRRVLLLNGRALKVDSQPVAEVVVAIEDYTGRE